ncbi:MAG: hypothetical protein DMG86_09820 [Acidobacteria bacterium]|nr:MAG: hypothetical protein DMG86_09820 [Acidobacteriota bacterium]
MFPAVQLNPVKGGRSQQHDLAAVDFLVWAAILVLGAFELHSHLRSPDFPFEDVAYFEQAKSLLHDGYYGFESVPERVQPPGLPLLLALICKVAGCRYGVLLSSMAVFITLGFLVWYQIIRQCEGRGIAAATCLLLGSSPWIFFFVTRGIWPSIPYFFVSGLALWIILKLDRAQTRSRRNLFSAALALIVAFSILIQSAGIALVGSMLASIGFTWLKDRGTAVHRFRVFLPAILLGIVTQFVWMHRGSNPPDWPLPGYPESYGSQLKLKLGNYPELGFANATDVFSRVKTNVDERTAVLAEILTAHWIHRSYASLAVAIPLVLAVVGVADSLLGEQAKTSLPGISLGSNLSIFCGPGSPSFDFFFRTRYSPVSSSIAVPERWPHGFASTRAACLLPVCMVLCAVAFRNSWAAGPSWSVGVQSKFSAAFWFAASLFSVRVICMNRPPILLSRLSERPVFLRQISIGSLSLTFLQMGALGLTVLLVARAISQDIPITRANLAFEEERFGRLPDTVAAKWIRLNTDPQDVVVARHVPLVFHYSQRKVIRFAPIVRPQVMMEGFRRLGIRYVIVVDRDFSYYLPPDEVCFDMVQRAYPNAFRLVAQLGQARIYEVIPAGVDGAANP